MARLLICSLMVAVVLLGGPAAMGDMVVLQPEKDNTLFDDTATGGGGQTSNGQGAGLFVGLVGNGSARRGLLSFDLAGSLPAGSTVNSVSLTLNVDMTGVGDVPISLHTALSDWGEGSSNANGMGGGGGGAPAVSGDATWLHTFFNSQFWATVGGDFEPVASASMMVGGSGPYTWGTTPEMVADVQSWLDDPAGNFGWVVVGDEASSPPTSKRIVSREGVDAMLRPQLVVDFDPPVGGPTPAPSIPTLDTAGLIALTMVIGAAAGIVLRRRRSY
ncbi:MAG: DNRLRE domain-containing protein [Deltaproteobacteria bacterium]|nr:DNRLRE domain-containing protein [Deltaproteobacteria bacterium]